MTGDTMFKATETTTCKICHRQTPPEGRQVCDSCMGFDRTNPKVEASEAPTESTLELCEVCGASIEPYQLGRNIIRRGQCKTCLMKKMYGRDWEPGGNLKKRLSAGKRCGDRKRALMKEKEAELTVTEPETNPIQEVASSMPVNTPVTHATSDAILGGLIVNHVTVPFEGDDEALYQRLKTLSLKERRSIEQQVLYFLEKVIKD